MDGEWEPPMIDNPEYKGEWKPKQIKNPEYKGKWVHPEIDNPEYTPDDKLYFYKDFGAIGFDLWQVKSGTIFDNIIVTDSVEEAKQFAEETWGATKDAEKKMKEKKDEEDRKKAEEEEKKRKDEGSSPLFHLLATNHSFYFQKTRRRRMTMTMRTRKSRRFVFELFS